MLPFNTARSVPKYLYAVISIGFNDIWDAQKKGVVQYEPLWNVQYERF
jgi:hypothetical protein